MVTCNSLVIRTLKCSNPAPFGQLHKMANVQNQIRKFEFSKHSLQTLFNLCIHISILISWLFRIIKFATRETIVKHFCIVTHH
jgi:hypothetical protein